jgi:2,3-bisphosphoglycerate-independent phosphoglycerate mutase
MKYIVVLTDGLADETYEVLGGKSPMESADIPLINDLAAHGEIGLVKTVPDSMAPGSDVANLSVLGYDPEQYHTGRSPLEAISMGIELAETDATMRCNLVTLSDEVEYQDRSMVDYSAGEISTEESRILIADLKEQLDAEGYTFYSGISYRHALVWNNPDMDVSLTPPHDISGKPIREHLPRGENADYLFSLMQKSDEILRHHPINLRRIQEGKNPANSVWFWGMGKKTVLDPFMEKYGLKGAVISAVDLIKGIALAAGMQSVDVVGANGTIKTNFKGKAEAAMAVLKEGAEYLYLHLEAPDECSHQGELREKIQSIELIERQVIAPLIKQLETAGEVFRMLILPDHPTPVRIRTHTKEAVPYVLYDSSKVKDVDVERIYSERQAEASGNYFSSGPALAAYFTELESREKSE